MCFLMSDNNKSRAESNPRFNSSIRNQKIDFDNDITKDFKENDKKKVHGKFDLFLNIISKNDWNNTARFAPIIKH